VEAHTAERWNPLNGNVEQVHYNARACNWMREDNTPGISRLVFANFLASTEDALGPSGTTSGENEEEELLTASGVEAQALTRTVDPRLQSRAGVVPIPVIGSGRKGAVITRSCYSSSASPASIDSTIDPSIYSR
jgi:hypothetical protein